MFSYFVGLRFFVRKTYYSESLSIILLTTLFHFGKYARVHCKPKIIESRRCFGAISYLISGELSNFVLYEFSFKTVFK